MCFVFDFPVALLLNYCVELMSVDSHLHLIIPFVLFYLVPLKVKQIPRDFFVVVVVVWFSEAQRGFGSWEKLEVRKMKIISRWCMGVRSGLSFCF